MGLRTLILAWAFLAPGFAQSFEASANGGYGVAERTGFGIPGVPCAGATFAWRDRVQFDYSFGHFTPGVIDYNRHFFTGSYVIQPHGRRIRPFLQFGGGIEYETNNANQVVNRAFASNDFRTAFAGVVGAGVTIEIGRAFFVRPQFRTYLAPGPNRTVDVTAFPTLAFGWRF
jgi:hypothetical protein